MHCHHGRAQRSRHRGRQRKQHHRPPLPRRGCSCWCHKLPVQSVGQCQCCRSDSIHRTCEHSAPLKPTLFCLCRACRSHCHSSTVLPKTENALLSCPMPFYIS
jgi:hypothetical protein